MTRCSSISEVPGYGPADFLMHLPQLLQVLVVVVWGSVVVVVVVVVVVSKNVFLLLIIIAYMGKLVLN